MNTEEFIKDAAKRGWSKTMTLEALGVSRDSFYAILEAMPPLEWPPQGKSLGHIQGNQARRGHCSPALAAALERQRQARKAKALHTANGFTGTIEEHAARSSVSDSTVRRRLKAGMTLEQALSKPATPFKMRRNSFNDREQRPCLA